MSRMQVDVDVHNDWAGGNGSSLTPEIYHLLCQKDKEELDDPRTRRQVLSRLKLEELFDHDDLEELELFAIREERKREQERSLEGANLKDAVIQRFLQQRTPQEIEEDERIMQQEVREAIEDAEAEAEGRNLSDSDEDDDYEQPEYDADLDIFVRVAFLAILERRLEDEERHRREEAEERTREESPQLESEERRGEERSQSGLEESREERRRRRLERLAEIEEEIVVLEPNSNNEPNAPRQDGSDSNSIVVASQNKTDDLDRVQSAIVTTEPIPKEPVLYSYSSEEKKKDRSTGFWDCFLNCLCCCI